jgi:hypothetical protein
MTGAVVLACALVALVLAASVCAKPRHGRVETQQPNLRASAYLGEKDGFIFALSLPSPQVVLFSVGRFSISDRRTFFALTSYATHNRGNLGHGRVRATFPGLGRISLRFVPSGKSREGHVQRHCEGRGPVRQEGSFRGTISMRGEGGYFRFSALRAQGETRRSFRLRCRGHEAEDPPSRSLAHYAMPSVSLFGPGSTIALLYAAADTGSRFTWVRAAHSAISPLGAEAQVGTFEPGREMAIGRSAYVQGGAGTLVTSLPGEHPALATLAPPPPFHGEATMTETSSTSHSWAGTLSVSFPGLDLPLAGPDFATSLCVVSPLKTPSGCDLIAPKPLVPLRPGVGR